MERITADKEEQKSKIDQILAELRAIQLNQNRPFKLKSNTKTNKLKEELIDLCTDFVESLINTREDTILSTDDACIKAESRQRRKTTIRTLREFAEACSEGDYDKVEDRESRLCTLLDSLKEREKQLREEQQRRLYELFYISSVEELREDIKKTHEVGVLELLGINDENMDEEVRKIRNTIKYDQEMLEITRGKLRDGVKVDKSGRDSEEILQLQEAYYEVKVEYNKMILRKLDRLVQKQSLRPISEGGSEAGGS